jgi:hypothetical protein
MLTTEARHVIALGLRPRLVQVVLIGIEACFASQRVCMSDFRSGSKADIPEVQPMSALPPKADVDRDSRACVKGHFRPRAPQQTGDVAR